MTRTVKVLGSLALLAVVGCEFHARSPEQYRDDTQAVIQSNAPAIEQCYTTALQQDKSLAGQVKVTFVVEAETGRVTNPQVDPSTTAPAALGQCVVQVLGGLALTPPDEREGQATWVFDFQPRPTPAVSAAPAASEPKPAAQAPAPAAPAAAQAAAAPAAPAAPAAAASGSVTATATTPK